MCAKTIRDLRIRGFNTGPWWPCTPGQSTVLFSLAVKLLFLMVFPASLLHFSGMIPRCLGFPGAKSSKYLRVSCWSSCWWPTASLSSATPRILSHKVLKHHYPSHGARDFSESDSKAKFGLYFTGHHKPQVQYLELHFKVSPHRVVQEKSVSLASHCLSSFLHLPKSKFRTRWAATVHRKSWGNPQMKWYRFVRPKQF